MYIRLSIEIFQENFDHVLRGVKKKKIDRVTYVEFHPLNV